MDSVESYDIFLFDIVCSLVVERHEMLREFAVVQLVLRIQNQENQVKPETNAFDEKLRSMPVDKNCNQFPTWREACEEVECFR